MNFATKYRPSRFAEVIGQDVSVRILRNSVWYGKHRSLLFSGIRGTGKTTLARLYAKALNCEKFKELGDICGECPACKDPGTALELDAASHSGVDDARELADIVRQIPKYKYNVIILDEAHMLSKQAQNALLKILEEAPKLVVFLLVTTDPDKILDTVRSRTLTMPLKTSSAKDAAVGIQRILTAEGLACDASFVDSLALHCEGSLRDIYQVLEQLVISAGDSPLTAELLESAGSILSTSRYSEIATLLCLKGYDGGLRAAFDGVNRWHQEGHDLSLMFLQGVPVILRDFMIHLSGCEVSYMSGISRGAFDQNLKLTGGDVKRFSREWDRTEEMMRTSSHPRLVWEMFLVKSFLNNEAEVAVSDY